MDVKDGMHCNTSIPWSRCGGSLGGVRCAYAQRTPPRLPPHLGHGILQCTPSLTTITGFIPSQLTTKTSGCYYNL